MYTAFFGLTQKPFSPGPDPEFLFLTEQHRDAVARVTYAVLQRKGIFALTGTAGMGKTALLAWVLQKLPAATVQASVILNATPALTRNEFLERAMLDFGIPDIPVSKAHRLQSLHRFLVKAQREGKISVLIVDEAHKLSSEVLDEIRSLGNFETTDENLLQVVLFGQSELDHMLSLPELWPFKQRVGGRLSLHPIRADEVGEYIEHRWRAAGGRQRSPFSSEAVAKVAQWSKGIPGLINSICDNALLEAFAEAARTVGATHIELAARDLLLIDRPPAAARPAPAPLQASGSRRGLLAMGILGLLIAAAGFVAHFRQPDPIRDTVAAASGSPLTTPAPILASPATATQNAAAAGRISHQVRLAILDPTWVSATADGKVVLAKTFQKGDSGEFQFSRIAFVHLGNSSGVELSLDGRPLRLIGNKGALRLIEITQQGARTVPWTNGDPPSPAQP